MTSNGKEYMSADRIMEAIDELKVVILGEKDNASLGLPVTDDYLAIASLFGMLLAPEDDERDYFPGQTEA